MHQARHLVLLLLLGILLSSCAHAPGAPSGSDGVLSLRQQYLSSNPDGRFNPYIERGQVIRGMKFTEVTASWGLPESRRLSRDREFEYWTFYGKDNESGDWMRYTFEFSDGVLVDWEVARHIAKNGSLESWAVRNQNPLIADRIRVPTSDETVIKR